MKLMRSTAVLGLIFFTVSCTSVKEGVVVAKGRNKGEGHFSVDPVYWVDLRIPDQNGGSRVKRVLVYEKNWNEAAKGRRFTVSGYPLGAGGKITPVPSKPGPKPAGAEPGVMTEESGEEATVYDWLRHKFLHQGREVKSAGGSGNHDAPPRAKSKPEPKRKPAVQSTPASTPTPQPTPKPATKPTPEPTPKPVATPKPLLKATPEPTPKPSPEVSKPASTPLPLTDAQKETRYRQAETKALEDRSVREWKKKAHDAKTDEDQQKAMREYQKALFKKMRELDGAIKERVDQAEAAKLKSSE